MLTLIISLHCNCTRQNRWNLYIQFPLLHCSSYWYLCCISISRNSQLPKYAFSSCPFIRRMFFPRKLKFLLEHSCFLKKIFLWIFLLRQEMTPIYHWHPLPPPNYRHLHPFSHRAETFTFVIFSMKIDFVWLIWSKIVNAKLLCLFLKSLAVKAVHFQSMWLIFS